MATTQSTRRKSSGFPWGLALLGIGAYLYWEHQKSATATHPSQTAPAVLPPVTSPATQPVPATTPATLQQSPATDDRSLVLKVAQQDGRPNFLVFAQTGSAADISLMANIIRGEWTQYGRCMSDQCTHDWSYIINKYNIH